MKKTLLFLSLFLSLCFSELYAFPSERNSRLNYILETLSQISAVISKEYYLRVSEETLYAGAAKEISEHNPKFSNIPVNNKASFEYYFTLSSEKIPSKMAENGELAVKGMLKSLNDPYSIFFDTVEWEYFKKMISGKEFTGIGVELAKKNGKLIIVAPLAGSPAERAGIAAGDIVRSVAGSDISKMDETEVLNLFTGVSGSFLDLVLERGGRLLTFKVKRAPLSLPSPKASILKSGSRSAGYVKISYFGTSTAGDIALFLERFAVKGIDCLIIDLRDNPGGELKSAVELASFFVGNEVLFKVQRKGGPPVAVRGSGSAKYSFNTIILVNAGSASAAELFASALSENGKAKLIGNTTFGKSLIQSVFSLRGNAGCRFTTARYYTSKGRDILYKGIKPDILISSSKSNPNANADRDKFIKEAFKNF